MGLFVAMAALVIIVLGLSQAALTSANTELEYRAMALPDGHLAAAGSKSERERVESGTAAKPEWKRSVASRADWRTIPITCRPFSGAISN